MNTSLSEKVIEDILCSDKAILAELLNVAASDLDIVVRQKVLESGILDLLCLHRDELLLIELKVVPFGREVIEQINSYHRDLLELQKQNRVINARIRKIVLVVAATPSEIDLCATHSIEVIVYKPQDVLAKFYENFRGRAFFLRIRPGDFGVVRLGLLNPALVWLSKGKSLSEICKLEGKSQNTIRNRLSVASLLGLVSNFRSKFYLTDSGCALLEKGSGRTEDRFTEEQLLTLSEFIIRFPFFSPVTFSILAVLESVFILSKNQYPVPFDALQNYFVSSVGKESTWKTKKARKTATYIYTNYACELMFLAKVGKQLYITPRGMQAILLLQLNRSIRLIEAQQKFVDVA